MLLGAAVSLAAGAAIMAMALAAGRAAGTTALATLLAVALCVGGAALLVLHMRTRGRCNLPCWPSRAARLSRHLIEGEGGGGGMPPYSPPRSATETTLATEEGVSPSSMAAGKADERVRLMESSDNADADRIADSAPRVVLM